MKKEKHLTVRIPIDLYEIYVKKTIDKSLKESKLFKLSEIIREILENNK